MSFPAIFNTSFAPCRIFFRTFAVWLVVGGGLQTARLHAQAVDTGGNTPKNSALKLDELVVRGEYDPDDERQDPTGMGGPTAEMDEPPFSNDLLAGGSAPPEEFDNEINMELQLATGASPVDLATGVNRVNLRGFPTPRLRNGFSQTGIPETLNVGYTELIQGPTTPLTGRAAPGGIRNFITNRPTGRSRTMLQLTGNTHDTIDARLDETTPVVARKIWQRVVAGWRETEGPMTYAHLRTRYLSGQITYRVTRSTSLMLSLDYLDLNGNPSPGVPEYRETTAGPVIGPYLPLLTFNAWGPNASLSKRLASAALQVESQLSRRVSLRANAQFFDRKLVDDRYTTGQYIVDLGRFGGTREPRRIEQPFSAYVASVEATARIGVGKTDHKLTLLVEQTHTEYSRTDRALTSADRNALPADMRNFNPWEPNYYWPEYSDELYRNLVTDRRENIDITSISLSERGAFWRGKLVTTAGVRTDFVSLEVLDRRASAPHPETSDDVTQFAWHAGANYLVKPGRLLAFGGISRAFEPSTRVDARTGSIQGNETTFGYEAGLKTMLWNKRLSATLLFFQYFNQNISRRNPLYDDPIHDRDHTQAQLLRSGEERFTGGTLDMKYTITPEFLFSARVAYVDPVTTKAPDSPEEVGRVLTRMPKATIGATLRYTFTKTFLAGFSSSLTLTYIDDFVAYYQTFSKPDKLGNVSVVREYLAYPGNTLVSLSLSRSWSFGDKKRPMRHTLSASVRNLLDRDQERSLYRAGQNRELTMSYRFMW